jgi:hypothetical protein
VVNACTVVGCHHDGDLANIHSAVAKADGGPCVVACHDYQGTGARQGSCTAAAPCHGPAGPHSGAPHAVITSSGTPSCTQDTCHGTNVVTIHKAGCFECHGSTDQTVIDAIADRGATCETCHGPYSALIPAHTAPANTSHAVSGVCYTALCHKFTDVGDVHTLGDDPPGCAACHDNAQHEATLECGTCHPTLTSYHGHVHHDASGTKSSACTGCHGTDLVVAHTGVFTHQENLGCFCHTTSYLSAEMAPLLAAGKAECVDCHGKPDDASNANPYHVITGAGDDYHAALTTNINTDAASCAACHGTDVNHIGSRLVSGGTVSVPASMTAPIQEHTFCSCHGYHEVTVGGGQSCIGCHNGGYGAIHGWKVTESARYPGLWNVSGHNTTTMGTVGARTDFSSLGVTDTVGVAPTAQFPLTVNNTFKTGYSWESTVTCEDCHAGLTAYEVAGPHGGNVIANAGIDPAYTGSFETASLWGGKYEQALANGTTLTIGPFAEGIAQWAPAGTTDEEKQELVNYQVVKPDVSTAASKKLVAGPAAVSAGTVICVKCHDLYDSTKTTGYKGWANYAHEHHSADTGSFTMYFGKFNVYNIASTSATTGAYVNTVVAESNATALSEAAALDPTAVALYYKVYQGADNKSTLLGNFFYRGDNATLALAEASATVPAYAGAKFAEVQTVIAPSLGREDAGACRNCHIAIPHGWKRPKLIVYSNLPDPSPNWRTAKGMPATGDSAPYNIGPAVYEGEGLAGTAVGSGQMNGMASGVTSFIEGSHLIGQPSVYTTSGTSPSDIATEAEEFPFIAEVNPNPLAKQTGDEYVMWSSAQCNACGHHSTTSFANPTAVQPPIAWNSREFNWTSTKLPNGGWK